MGIIKSCVLSIAVFLAQFVLARESSPMTRTDFRSLIRDHAVIPVDEHSLFELSFLGDSILAATVTNGSKIQDSPASIGKSAEPLHFAIYTFDISGGNPKFLKAIALRTDSRESSVAALPTGNFLVNSDREVALYDNDLKLLNRVSVDSICGLNESWLGKDSFQSRLFPHPILVVCLF